MIQTLHKAAEAALAFVYPEICNLCAVQPAQAADGYVCPACRSQLRFVVPPFCARCGLPFQGEVQQEFECSNCKDMPLAFAQARSAIQATGVGLELVHQYKYHRALWFEPLFKQLIQASAGTQTYHSGYDAVIPVPLHREKQCEREFNQAERLARILSQELQLPVLTQCLAREAETQTQTQLSRRERAKNVASAFSLRDQVPASIKRVILVDDVLTTGSTTHACARVLRGAGVREVGVWTLARGV